MIGGIILTELFQRESGSQAWLSLTGHFLYGTHLQASLCQSWRHAFSLDFHSPRDSGPILTPSLFERSLRKNLQRSNEQFFEKLKFRIKKCACVPVFAVFLSCRVGVEDTGVSSVRSVSFSFSFARCRSRKKGDADNLRSKINFSIHLLLFLPADILLRN